MKKNLISINPIMANLSFAKFKIWHKKWVKDDSLTSEQRYVKLGGKVPKKNEE